MAARAATPDKRQGVPPTTSPAYAVARPSTRGGLTGALVLCWVDDRRFTRDAVRLVHLDAQRKGRPMFPALGSARAPSPRTAGYQGSRASSPSVTHPSGDTDSCPDRWLILTAAMGSGHDRAAAALAAEACPGGVVRTVDVFAALPAGLGRSITGGYAGALRWAPWLYEAAFREFMAEGARECGVSPLAVAVARRLRRVVAELAPTVVVSTFHLAGQVAGVLRERGWCDAETAVLITEPAAHPAWLHPATDLYVCPYPWVADYVRRRSQAEVLAPGPLVAPAFFRGDAPAGRHAMHLAADEEAVLISAGSWGTGRRLEATTQLLARAPGLRPVVLCGRDERLRRRIARIGGALALGWRKDLPDLCAGAGVLLDNAGGGMCAEAFAAGLPVVGWRPLPGHGRLGLQTLAAEGVVTLARDEASLLATVRRLLGPSGEHQRSRARRLFRADPTAVFGTWARRGRSRGVTGAPPVPVGGAQDTVWYSDGAETSRR